MTKISRPFQIALVAVVLLAAVYFVALRKHSSSSESSAPAPVASTATPSSASTAPGAGTSASSSSAASPSSGSSAGGTSTYKGSAPGVDGLTRAIQKARGAVSESEQNAKALQQKATAASGTTENLGSSATGAAGAARSAAVSGGTAAATHGAATTHAAGSAAAAVKAKSKTPASKTGATKTASGVPVMQARVERELKRGDVAALLFWNPSGAVDNTVRRELQATARKLHGKLAISVARSSEVGSFGTFTRTVQVYGTPTILLINPAGKTVSVTGLTDVFSLEQAVREIKHSQ
ncbi:MAG TPA: hypothetical protein VN817_01015 [Solirubrobacteraceae bacterium]|nr:hypothetical protein [Solirubrobacteraceae bacterium]